MRKIHANYDLFVVIVDEDQETEDEDADESKWNGNEEVKYGCHVEVYTKSDLQTKLNENKQQTRTNKASK